MKITVVGFIAFLAWAAPVAAWNVTGHKIISAMTYDQLTATAKARVDELIRSHPDYQSHFLRGVPVNMTPAARARAAFINASIWPDQIRDDPRFYNEERIGAQSPPLLAGFPDMGRHTNWHYINIPFSQDGTPLREAPKPNAVTEIERLTNAIASGSGSNRAYALPWLMHLVEDLHNPLHTVARFSRENPDGDRGGNLIFVKPGGNLHAFWDSLGGGDPKNSKFIDQEAKKLLRTGTKYPISIEPFEWALEGEQEAKKSVYTFGNSSGTPNQPIPLSREYQMRAKQLYTEEFYTAAARLAEILNRQLK